MTKNIVIVLVIIALGFIVYGNSFQNQFLFDDIDQIVNNSAIKSFSNIPMVFTHSLTAFGLGLGGDFYRPVQTLTLMSDNFFWGLETFGYHLSNTILHILAAILFFLLARIALKDILLSALAALIYLVHPVHTEAVAYISGRADSLSAIFLILMLLFSFQSWLKKGIASASYYILALVSFALALLSKESAVVFPFLLVLFDYCARDEKGYSNITLKRSFSYLPLFAILAAYLIIKNLITPISLGSQTPLSARLIAAPRMVWDYIRLSFLPVGLHMEYRFPFPKSIFQPGYFEPVIAPILYLAGLFYFWNKGKSSREHRIAFFGLAWFGIALLMYLNIIIEINALFAEHWLYIAEMGIIIAVVQFAAYATRNSALARKAVLIISAVIVLLFSIMTIRQNAVWKDSMTFFTYTTRVSPHSGTAWNNLGLVYLDKGDRERALELFEKAVKADPAYAIAAENLANLKREMGR